MAPRCPVGLGGRAYGTCPPATRRGERGRRRIPRGAGPHSEFGVRDSGKAFCGRATGPPAVTRGVAASLLPPSPSHPSGSSNVGPKSLGPTTTNRRHRFRDVSVGAGGPGSTRRGSRGPSRLDSAPSGHRARWHKQPHAGWGLGQSVAGLGEEPGRLDKTIVQIRRRLLGEELKSAWSDRHLNQLERGMQILEVGWSGNDPKRGCCSSC